MAKKKSGGTTRWWWVRHAPVTTDGGRVYGQMDIACDCSDTAAFARLAGWLPRDAVLLTSQLQRTHQTAEGIRQAGLALPDARIEPGIAEQHFGEWQGQVRKEIFARLGARHGFWLAPAHTAPKGGESFAALQDRVGTAVARLTEEHKGRDIIAVAHGGTIRAAVGHALGLDPESSLAVVVDNLSLTRLDHIDGGGKGDGWRIATVNRVSRDGDGLPVLA